MDDIVTRALRKWPDVPDVFGWLRLDRRGRWLLQVRPGEFGPIGNAALNAFISRNYQADAQGRWFFQNGPQRVFVTLDCAPWVYRLDDHRRGWLAHTGAPAGTPRELLCDETGGVLLLTGLGLGAVIDRDIAALLDELGDEGGQPVDAESLFAALRAGQRLRVKLLGTPVLAASVNMADKSAIASQYGFDPDPRA